MRFYIGINGKCCPANFPLFAFDIFIKLIEDIQGYLFSFLPSFFILNNFSSTFSSTRPGEKEFFMNLPLSEILTAWLLRQDYWPHRAFGAAPYLDRPPLHAQAANCSWHIVGTCRGGLIDFGKRYHKCTINELLEKLTSRQQTQNFSFHPPNLAGEKKDTRPARLPSKKKNPTKNCWAIQRQQLAKGQYFFRSRATAKNYSFWRIF